MRFRVSYESRVGFPAPVREHQCELRLLPQEGEHQRVEQAAVQVDPPAPVFHYLDAFGNRVHHFGVVTPHAWLTSRLESVVENTLAAPLDYPALPPEREMEWIAHSLRDVPRLWDYVVHRSPSTPDTRDLGDTDWPRHAAGRPLLESVQEAVAWLASRYPAGEPRLPQGELRTALDREEAPAPGDLAHLLISILRSWEVPARFVTGYCAALTEAETPGAPPQPAAVQRQNGTDKGRGDALTSRAQPGLHAWVEVLIPGAGWRGFDPSLGGVAAEGHLAVAVGRDHRDTEPQRGSYQGQDQGCERSVRVRVEPL